MRLIDPTITCVIHSEQAPIIEVSGTNQVDKGGQVGEQGSDGGDDVVEEGAGHLDEDQAR